MKKIGYIQISSGGSGGTVYTKKALQAISSDFKTEIINHEPKYFKKWKFLKALAVFFNILFFKGEKDLWIRNFYSTAVLNKKRTGGKNIALLFHVDFSGFSPSLRPFLFFFEKVVFYRQLKKMDCIVTISEYWKGHFLEKGYSNVEKIYCGFDLNDFNITEEEILNFKEKYKLKNKPIIYLGNCQKAKGVPDSYDALKNLDVHFVASGFEEVKIPALSLDLNYREYLILLKSSSIVLAMSKFKEGWCITAHEAMLLKTPVIGSGLGGMKELLEGGKQIICKDFKQLKKKVEYLLKNPEERRIMSENGYSFAKTFTDERFKESWMNLINKILR